MADAGPKDEGQYATEAAQVFPANVVMFSGCKDNQTSADVHDTSSFGIVNAASGAGGACTSSMIKALEEKSDWSWATLLGRMRTILRQGRYTQIPQLSSSRAVDMNAPFSVVNSQPAGNKRVLLVGLNYQGSSCPLSGCHNDVETMRRYLDGNGYEGAEMKILMDDGRCEVPTKAAIEAGMQWLVEGAGPGDSLFFHYSGHGAQLQDDDGDEKDGKDEALCPSDFQTAGLLRDDDVFHLLVSPLGEGVQLTCVLDCCHSGTILDLPYMFKADDESMAALEAGEISTMGPNGNFDIDLFIKLVQKRPGLCAAAAIVGGVAYVAMDDESRQQVQENSDLFLGVLMCCIRRDLESEDTQST